jgi:hypothetical protein
VRHRPALGLGGSALPAVRARARRRAGPSDGPWPRFDLRDIRDLVTACLEAFAKQGLLAAFRWGVLQT